MNLLMLLHSKKFWVKYNPAFYKTQQPIQTYCLWDTFLKKRDFCFEETVLVSQPFLKPLFSFLFFHHFPLSFLLKWNILHVLED